MTNHKKLELLTKSIRMINQAKIFKNDIKKLDEAILALQRTKLRFNLRVDDLVREAHKIQFEVIPVTIVPPKKERKPRITKHKGEKIDNQTLERIFGKKEAAKLTILAEKAGLFN